MKARLLYGLLAGGVLLALSGQANANTVTIFSQDATDFTAGTLPVDQAQVTLTNVSGTTAQDITGSASGTDRSPFENLATPGSGAGTWASNRYDAVQGNSSGYVNVDPTSMSMTMLWGSPDSYNTISFCTGAGGGGSCTVGAYVPSVLPITYGHDLITFNADFAFASILFSSGQNALEFANLTVSPNNAQPAPLPAALPLFAGGLGVLGLLSWRRKRKSAALAAA